MSRGRKVKSCKKRARLHFANAQHGFHCINTLLPWHPGVSGCSDVCRCPPLLTVHVKRFQQDMRGRLSKIDGAVPFPINLNLNSFCDPKVLLPMHPFPNLFVSSSMQTIQNTCAV